MVEFIKKDWNGGNIYFHVANGLIRAKLIESFVAGEITHEQLRAECLDYKYLYFEKDLPIDHKIVE